MTHPLEDCPHNETFMHISATLKRLDRHTERSAIAMEEMAAQGAILKNHEVRMEKQDKDIGEAFSRIRILEDTTVSVEDFDKVRHKVSKMELQHAKEYGADEVIEKQQEFWSGVKQQVTANALMGMLFIIWLVDKFNVAQAIAKLWKEMKG